MRREGDAFVFDRWRGGEFGRMDPHVAAGAAEQMWTGTNVVRYRTGLLGPRAGLKELELTTPPTGVVGGFGNAVDTTGTGPWAWVALDGDVHLIDIGAGTVSAAYTGSPLTLTHPLPTGGYAGTSTYVNIAGDSVRVLNHVAKTITQVAAGVAGTCIGWYGNNSYRAVASEGASIYWSEPFPAWTSWPAENTIAIGSALPITMLREYRDGLLVAKESGEMHLVTGPLNNDSAQLSVRRLSRSGGPRAERWGIALEGDIVWYLGYQRDFPSSFNGSIHEQLDWLDFTGGVMADDTDETPGFGFVPAPWLGPQAWLLVSGQSGAGAQRALEFTGDTFAYHTFGVATSGWAVCLSDPAADAVTNGSIPALLLAAADGSGYWFYQPGLDRPGFAGDTYAQPGDGEDAPLDSCEFTLPDVWDPAGEVQINEVVVKLRGWDTGSATNVTAKVKVDALAPEGDPGVAAGSELTVVNIDPGDLSTSGTDITVEASVAGANGQRPIGAGFRVTVSDLHGCAVRSVAVIPHMRGR